MQNCTKTNKTRYFLNSFLGSKTELRWNSIRTRFFLAIIEGFFKIFNFNILNHFVNFVINGQNMKKNLAQSLFQLDGIYPYRLWEYEFTESFKIKSLLALTLVTPFIRLVIWEHTVLTAANSFLFPNHFSTRTVFLFGMEISTAKCLKLFTNVPLGPLTVTTRDLTLTSTSSGTLTDWLVLITFILENKGNLIEMF